MPPPAAPQPPLTPSSLAAQVIRGAQPVQKPSTESGDLAKFMQWVDARRRLRVLTNAGEAAGAARGDGTAWGGGWGQARVAR